MQPCAHQGKTSFVALRIFIQELAGLVLLLMLCARIQINIFILFMYTCLWCALLVRRNEVVNVCVCVSCWDALGACAAAAPEKRKSNLLSSVVLFPFILFSFSFLVTYVHSFAARCFLHKKNKNVCAKKCVQLRTAMHIALALSLVYIHVIWQHGTRR